MLYLVRKKKPKVAHIFTNGDTACRLYSTGGMNKKRYRVSPDADGQPLCLMCKNVAGTNDVKAVKSPATSDRQELARLISGQKKDMARGYL